MKERLFLKCTKCGNTYSKIWFIEEERTLNNARTGRIRNAVSHLLCEHCGHKEVVDDSFDMPWHFPIEGKK